jgi:hypothetical protein
MNQESIHRRAHEQVLPKRLTSIPLAEFLDEVKLCNMNAPTVLYHAYAVLSRTING